MEQTTEAEVAEVRAAVETGSHNEGTAIDDGSFASIQSPPVGAAEDVGEQAAEPAGISATIVAFPRGRRPRREVNGAKRAQLRPPGTVADRAARRIPILDMAGEDPLPITDHPPP